MSERFPDGLDRMLTPEQQMAFASEVIWPAIDHLQKKHPRKDKRLELVSAKQETEYGTALVAADAMTHYHRKVENEAGEPVPYRMAEIVIALARPELNEGLQDVLDIEPPDDEDEDEEDDTVNENEASAEGSEDEDDDEDYQWWRDSDLRWQTWEVWTFMFSNDESQPLLSFYDIEAKIDGDEVEGHLWSFLNEGDPYEAVDGVEKLELTDEQRDELNDAADERREQLHTMLSYGECMEIRAALMRLGVPAEAMAHMQ